MDAFVGPAELNPRQTRKRRPQVAFTIEPETALIHSLSDDPTPCNYGVSAVELEDDEEDSFDIFDASQGDPRCQHDSSADPDRATDIHFEPAEDSSSAYAYPLYPRSGISVIN